MHRTLAEVADTGLEARHKVVEAADDHMAAVEDSQAARNLAAVVEDNQAARTLAEGDTEVRRDLAEAGGSLACFVEAGSPVDRILVVEGSLAHHILLAGVEDLVVVDKTSLVTCCFRVLGLYLLNEASSVCNGKNMRCAM